MLFASRAEDKEASMHAGIVRLWFALVVLILAGSGSGNGSRQDSTSAVPTIWTISRGPIQSLSHT